MRLYVEGAVHRAGTSRVCGGLGVFSEGHECHARFVRGVTVTPQLMAVRAARYALDHCECTAECSPCELVTSSRYLIKLVKAWGPGWRRRGWMTKRGKVGGSLVNQEMQAFLELLWARGATVRLVDLADPADRRGYEAATVLQYRAAELGARGGMRKARIKCQPW